MLSLISLPSIVVLSFADIYSMQVMIPYNYTEFIDGLKFLVKNKFIQMSRIDDAVKRILRVKFIMGMFENPLADLSLVNHLGSKVSCICQEKFNLFSLDGGKILNNSSLCIDRNTENWPGKVSVNL